MERSRALLPPAGTNHANTPEGSGDRVGHAAGLRGLRRPGQNSRRHYDHPQRSASAARQFRGATALRAVRQERGSGRNGPGSTLAEHFVHAIQQECFRVHGGTFDASRRILTGLRPASAVCSFFAHAIAGRYGRRRAPAATQRRRTDSGSPGTGRHAKAAQREPAASVFGASIRRDAVKTRGSRRALVPCAVLLSPCCLQLKSL